MYAEFFVIADKMIPIKASSQIQKHNPQTANASILKISQIIFQSEKFISSYQNILKSKENKKVYLQQYFRQYIPYHMYQKSQNTNHADNTNYFQLQNSEQLDPLVKYLQNFYPEANLKSSTFFKEHLGKLTDKDGNTILHHMCSINSNYLTLYIDNLHQGHQQLNLLNKFGMNPLDIAAMFCGKQIMDKLKAKGAKQSINGTDYWCIRQGNLDCWSGKVPVQKKQLIHWAAYNDLPEVLMEFKKQKADLNLSDNNGFTPIDTAFIRNSYKSFEYLLNLGFDLTMVQDFKNYDSPSLQRLYRKYKSADNQSKIDPFIFIVLLLLIEVIFNPGFFFIPLSVPLFYFLSRCTKFQPLYIQGDQRIYSFYSWLMKKQIQYGTPHLLYIFFLNYLFCTNMLMLVFTNIQTLFDQSIKLLIIVIQIVLAFSILMQFYGIVKNLGNSKVSLQQEFPNQYEQVPATEDYNLQRKPVSTSSSEEKQKLKF